jgi:hypothetical protein
MTAAAKLKPPRKVLPSSFRPWPCVLLCIDPGNTSGWAIFVQGTLHAHGTCRFTKLDIIHMALDIAEAASMKLIVVREKWATAHWKSKAAPIGIGAAWGGWRESLRIKDVPPRAVVEVYPRTWQAATVGGRQLKSDDQIKAVQAFVKLRLGIDAKPDAAAAIGIGMWGTYAGEVGEALERCERKRGKA